MPHYYSERGRNNNLINDKVSILGDCTTNYRAETGGDYYYYYLLLLSLFSQEDLTSGVASSDQSFDLPDDMANRMSLFYANPTPILHGLAGATSQLLKEVSNLHVLLPQSSFLPLSLPSSPLSISFSLSFSFFFS